MANTKHRIIRGKMIKQGDLLVDSHQDGGMHIKLGGSDTNLHGKLLELSEEQALQLGTMLNEMIDWGGSPED